MTTAINAHEPDTQGSTTVLQCMSVHRSIRKYTSQPITPEMLDRIINAAKQASSSSFLQCISLVNITEPGLRADIATLSGHQVYVSEAPVFLIFCADFQRHHQICPDIQLGYTEQLMMASIDAGLMGQNVLLAAESLGLGGVFIGGIRNQPLAVCERLHLPEHVFPLFGLCLGWPDQDPEVKPRLPNELLVHENHYHPLDRAALTEYDQTIQEYYLRRTGNPRDARWSVEISTRLQKESRPFMREALHHQGFAKK